jgi:1-acyl-sn-glycerol-3-phosphate acyltransferase
MDNVPTWGADAGRLIWFARTWQGFCRLVVRVFYRRFEVVGCENLLRRRDLKTYLQQKRQELEQ